MKDGLQQCPGEPLAPGFCRGNHNLCCFAPEHWTLAGILVI